MCFFVVVNLRRVYPVRSGVRSSGTIIKDAASCLYIMKALAHIAQYPEYHDVLIDQKWIDFLKYCFFFDL